MDNMISAVILTFNSEMTIKKTIHSLSDVVDEIVIVDSGSTDDTVTLSMSLSDKVVVVESPWEGSFSTQRNIGIDRAQGKWILMIDSDEYLHKDSRRELNKILNSSNDDNVLYAPIIINSNLEVDVVNNPRLFLRSKENRYKGNVHEYIDSDAAIELASNFKIVHSGYDDPSIVAIKNTRNRELLNVQIGKEPNDIRWKYFMLRYLNPLSTEYKSILDFFSKIKLPYEENVEVYCLNVKHQIIKFFILNGDIDAAIKNAYELSIGYNDKNTHGILIFLEYIKSRNDFFLFLDEMKKKISSLSKLDDDMYIYHKFDFKIFELMKEEIQRIEEIDLI